MPRRELRTVNRILGSLPNLGPFPADQIVPWASILIFSFVVVRGFFQASWLVTGIITAWGIATWWTLSTNKNFFGKFIGTPRIVRGYKPFDSFVNPVTIETKKTIKTRTRRQRK